MITIPISEFRSNMPAFIAKVKRGIQVSLTSHGKIVAVVNPPTNDEEDARKRLKELRKNSWVGDVVSPMDTNWEAQD